jgi:hypothetical protein
MVETGESAISVMSGGQRKVPLDVAFFFENKGRF